MIIKMPWPQQKHTQHTKYGETGYNPRRNQTFILSDEHYNAGKPLLDTVFETEIAPLITEDGIKYKAIPKDGDPQNTNLQNILIAGPGHNTMITREEAIKGNILRCEYDPDDDVFSYVYVRNGVNEEIRTPTFAQLRTRAGRSATPKLYNKKNLLTPQQYKQMTQQKRLK